MASATGTNGSDVFYMSTFGAPTGGATSHGYNALGGNDTVYGSAYVDIIQGGTGNDVLYGYGGSRTSEGGNNDLYVHALNSGTVNDGAMDDGVIIKDFYAGDANTFIEWAYTSDNQWVDLTQLI